MRIYVSLPITGYDLEERKARALELKRRFEREGQEAVTPFDLDWEEGKDYAHYMGNDYKDRLGKNGRGNSQGNTRMSHGISEHQCSEQTYQIINQTVKTIRKWQTTLSRRTCSNSKERSSKT